MPIEQFIVQIAGVCTVPILVFVIVLMFRKPVYDFLRPLNSMSAKALGAEISAVAEKLKETNKEVSESEKKAVAPVRNEWNRDQTGHLYWFASDLSFAVGIARAGRLSDMQHFARQLLWHATQLALGSEIEGRFARLCKKIASYSEDEWEVKSISEIEYELLDLLHLVAYVVGGKGTDFQSDPPSDWDRC